MNNKRPFIIRAFNSLNIQFKLDALDLIKEAKKKTGLSEFGDGDIEKALSKLISSINKEAQLHSFGRYITKKRISNVLENRLRIQDVLKQNPEILDIQIENPIFITGVQRTGTTRLHRLMAAHPKVRSLTSWESLNPAPLSKDSNNIKRKNFAKTAERALKFMSPSFFAIHPVESEAPEEDVLINDMTFISAVPEATMWLPTYAKWVSESNGILPYTFLKKVLQVLHWQNPNERWVLKTPQHLENMIAIHHVFPDAKIIHTYRDPLKSIPSFSSMLHQSYLIFSDNVDIKQMANHWLLKDVHMVNSAMNYWKNNKTDVLNISYYEMMNDFKSEIEKICAFTGLIWNDNIYRQIDKANNKNSQNKYGKHQYKMEDFGLKKERIDKLFNEYRKHYNIPYE